MMVRISDSSAFTFRTSLVGFFLSNRYYLSVLTIYQACRAWVLDQLLLCLPDIGDGVAVLGKLWPFPPQGQVGLHGGGNLQQFPLTNIYTVLIFHQYVTNIYSFILFLLNRIKEVLLQTGLGSPLLLFLWDKGPLKQWQLCTEPVLKCSFSFLINMFFVEILKF